MSLILVLDDLPDAVALFKTILKRFDFEVIAVQNGVEGLKFLATTGAKPVLIICDLKMPQMDGLTFLQQLHQQPQWRSIPFILTTPHVAPETVKIASEYGVNSILLKPFTIAALKSRLIELDILPPES